MLDRLRYLCSRVGPWPRRLAALACLLLAATSALSARGKETGPASTRVVVTAHALPAGHRLAANDLTVRTWPKGVFPAGAVAVARSLVGRRLAGPLARGEPVTGLRLVGRELTSGMPTGTVAVTVDVDDPHIADLVRPGDRIDVLAPAAAPDSADIDAAHSQQPPVTLAEGVRVLAVLTSKDSSTGSGAGNDYPEIVIASTRATATRLAGHAGVEPFAVVTLSP